MTANIHESGDDKVVQETITEQGALQQAQSVEETVKTTNAPTGKQPFLDLAWRVRITRLVALIIVSAALAALAVQRPNSPPPRQIQSYGEAFLALSILGGLLIALVDLVASLIRRAIWGQVDTVTAFTTATLPTTTVPAIGAPNGVSRAKSWAGLGIVVLIASGLVVFSVQGRRITGREQQRRDCLQLSTLRLQENRPPLPPPPPPIPPGMKINGENEDQWGA
jgi:hypothetical protein